MRQLTKPEIKWLAWVKKLDRDSQRAILSLYDAVTSVDRDDEIIQSAWASDLAVQLPSVLEHRLQLKAGAK